MARIHQVRQRLSDGFWDYTVSSDDEGWAHASGACGQLNASPCCHATKEEAEQHQRDFIRDQLKKAERHEIDTKIGHPCHVKGCIQPAFFYVSLPHYVSPFHGQVELCAAHLENPET